MNGSLATASAVSVALGATLTGTGTAAGPVTLVSGATIRPTAGLGILRTGNLALTTGSTLALTLNGNTLGTQYGQVSVSGTVNLTGSTLSLSGIRAGDHGHILTILANDGTDPIIGTFKDLPELAQVTVNGVPGVYYTLSYVGNGDGVTPGNDITLTDKNLDPTNIALSSTSVLMDQAFGTPVGSFTTTDPNTADTFTYSLADGTGATDNDLFAVSGNQLFALAEYYPIDVTYSIRVRTTDQGGLTFDKVLTITSTAANRAPTDLTLSGTTVPEKQLVGTVVGTLYTTDLNGWDTFSYSLVAGTGSADNGSFSIVDDQLVANASFVYNVKSSYSIRVRATDSGGLYFEKALTVSVTNVNETPTNIALSSASIGESRPSGTVVGTLSSADPDPANTFTYSLVTGTGSDDNDSFTISGNQLKTAAAFNYETKRSYSIRVRSTDQGGLSFEKVFAVSVTLVTAPPADSISVTAQGSYRFVQLNWSRFDELDVDGYHIYRSTDNANWAPVGDVKAGPPTDDPAGVQLGYGATSLSPDTQYYFRVCPYNAAGNRAAALAQARTLPSLPAAPPAVTILPATIPFTGYAAKIFQWQDNANNEASFKVTAQWYYSMGGNPYVETTETFLGAISGTGGMVQSPPVEVPQNVGFFDPNNYTVVASAVAINPSGRSDMPSTPTPSNLVTTTLSDTEVELKWAFPPGYFASDVGYHSWTPGAKLEGYRIEGTPQGQGNWQQLASCNALPDGISGFPGSYWIANPYALTKTYRVRGLTPATPYEFRVVAFSARNDTTPTNIAKALTTSGPLLSADGKVNLLSGGAHVTQDSTHTLTQSADSVSSGRTFTCIHSCTDKGDSTGDVFLRFDQPLSLTAFDISGSLDLTKAVLVSSGYYRAGRVVVRLASGGTQTLDMVVKGTTRAFPGGTCPNVGARTQVLLSGSIILAGLGPITGLDIIDVPDWTFVNGDPATDPNGDGPGGPMWCHDWDGLQEMTYSNFRTSSLVDLDIDSDNDNGVGSPSRSSEEDRIEELQGSKDHPGKIIQGDLGLENRATARFYQGVIELPSWLDISIANIQISYDADQVMLWNVDNVATRSLPSIKSGGNYIAPDTYTAQQLGLSGAEHKATFYIEGGATSAQWGGCHITVSVDLDGNGPAGFVSVDTVSLTVVDYRFKAYVVEPYTYGFWTGSLWTGKRVLFNMDYSSPASMRASATNAFLFKGDVKGKDEGWHGVAAFMGHAFCQLTYVDPDHRTNLEGEYFGSTGQNGLAAYAQAFVDSLTGDLPWTNFGDGHKNSEADLSPWISNTNKISANKSASTATVDLVQRHTWVIQQSVADGLYKLLSENSATTNPYGRTYSNYGLDINRTQGGCASLVGLAMEGVGFSDQSTWEVHFGGEQDSKHRPLTFFDPGLMGAWMRGQTSKITFYTKESTWGGCSAVWPLLQP